MKHREPSSPLPFPLASAYVALGSNLGDREEALLFGLTTIAAELGRLTALSAFFETAPVGGPPQGLYLNAVCSLHTTLPPQDFLARLLAIEARAGRERSVRWGPRTLDLDLLLYNDCTLSLPASPTPDGQTLPALELPHPRLHLRTFVLRPLAQIAPDLLHPTLHRTIRELLQACPDPSDGVPFQASQKAQICLAALHASLPPLETDF